MATFPEIAYPEPGWMSRFVGRTTQLAIIDRLIASTDRGVVLPIVQVVGKSGVGKSWFLQKIRWQLRNSFDTPSVLLRFSNPAMAQIDRAAEALVSRLINRWRMSPRLSEFVLGRIADLKGENFDRFTTYAIAHKQKIIPALQTKSGERELRKILVERGVEHLRRLWGDNWGKKFLKMSPQQLAWHLPDLLGIDIDDGVRTLRYRTFVLLVDDADKIPALYMNMIRLKKRSSLTLLVMASEKPFPTDGHPVETIPLEPLPLLERRAYFYLLGIDTHKKQNKITQKHNQTSIDYAIGAVEAKQILERNPALKRLMGTLLVCHRPSLEVVREIIGDTGTIASFFAEPALVDLLEHPDRLPWRFSLHPRVRRWAIRSLEELPIPEKSVGDAVNKLAIFANKNFNEGMGEIYWFFRHSMLSGNAGDAVDALFCADEVAENSGKDFFKHYHRFLLEINFAPPANTGLLRDYVRQLVLGYDRKCPSCLVAAAHFFAELGEPRYAIWTARGVLPRISGEITGPAGKKGVFGLMRSETHRVIGKSFLKLGNPEDALVHLNRALDAAALAGETEPALSDESTIEQIAILQNMFEVHIHNDERKKARDCITRALELANTFINPAPHKQPVGLTLAGEILDNIYRADMLEEEPEIFKPKIEIIIDACEDYLSRKDDYAVKLVLARAKLYLSVIYLAKEEHSDSLEASKQALEIINDVGEKARWLADLWRKLSVEAKLIQAENHIALGNYQLAFELARQSQDTISIWSLEEQTDTAIWAIKARVIGGIALARMRETELAHTWLNAGIALAEKVLSRREITSPVYFNLLCGQAYLELARLQIEQGAISRAKLIIERGIEHFMEVISIFDSPQPRFTIVEMYILLMEIDSRNPDNFLINYENAVLMLTIGCRMCEVVEPKAVELAEKLFNIAMNLPDNFPEDVSAKIRISSLSLYPFLRDKNLIKQAYDLINSIDEENLSEELRSRFISVRRLAEEFKKFRVNPGD